MPLSTLCKNVRDFGAIGDGVHLDSDAINQAIQACHQGGGGTVWVPAGTYLIGTVEILSQVTLHLDAGSVLKGSPNLVDYRVLPMTSEFRNTALIVALGAQNIAITGRGVIDGNAAAFAIHDRADLSRDFAASCTRQGEAYFEINDQAEDGPILHKPRPGILILLHDCREVLVSQVKIMEAPNWCLHLSCCEDALLTGLDIKSSLIMPNSDGIDVSLSRNVRISDCTIEAGDEGIAFSPCADGFGGGILENITVQNCILSSRSAGIRIGWGGHSFRNMLFNNIIIRNSNRGIGLFIRGGETIENVIFSNIIIETRLYKGKWWGKAEPVHLSTERDQDAGARLGCIRNITFTHMQIEAEHGMVLSAAENGSISHITFTDIRIRLQPGELQESFGGNFDLRPARDERKKVFSHDIPALYAKGVDGLEIEDFTDLTIDEFRAAPSPSNSDSPAIVLRRGHSAVIRNCPTPSGAFLSSEDVKDLTRE
jgi:polygalacturonase